MISINDIYANIADKTHTDIGTVKGVLADSLELQPVVFEQGRPKWGTENKDSTNNIRIRVSQQGTENFGNIFGNLLDKAGTSML